MCAAINKAERLIRLEALILSSSGIKRAEIARRFNVDPSTITRDIDELSLMDVPVQEDDDNYLFIDKSSYLNNIRFTRNEAVYVYLACKLISSQVDRKSTIAASAIRKLGLSIKNISESIANQMFKDSNNLDCGFKTDDKEFRRTMDIFSISWTKNRLARFQYRSTKEKALHFYEAGIFLFLPHSAGQTILALGYCPLKNEVRMFRIDRVSNAVITDKIYKTDKLPVWEEKLKNAWNVWCGDKNPVDVVLRFSSRVSRRVKETVWHSSQIINDQPDGSVLASYKITEPEEMLPWIRGWGSDVEVVKPENLRLTLIEEVKKMKKIYGI